jgi:DNA-binding transcriptional LysR family regulator
METLENFRLKVFRAVARHLNFTRAAEELLLTQPAVTQQIRALEDELGLPLIDRGGGRIALTPAGEALLPYAERLKALGEEAIEAVQGSAGSESGTLLLGASQTIAQYLLPRFIVAFSREQPRVSIHAISGNTDAMLEALADHRIQLALIEGPGRRRDLHIEPFMDDQMVLVVPAGHEWAGQEIAPDDLARAPFLMRELGSGSRRIVEAALAKVGLKKKDIRTSMEIDSTEGLLSAVEAGLGVTFVSRWAARNHLALGTVALAHVTGLRLSRRFAVAYPSGPAPKGSAGLFHQFLLGQARHEMSSSGKRDSLSSSGSASLAGTPKAGTRRS